MRSEKEKMLNGELYDPLDQELVEARERVRDLFHELNLTRERDHERRRQILKDLFGQGGDTANVQPPFYCDYGSNIFLGERVYFNFNCVVLDVCKVTIGSFTLFAPNVQIFTATHPFDVDVRKQLEFGLPVTIGESVWVGGGTIICPGVTIGSNSIIGAGSVVTKEIPDNVVAVGNPCRVLRKIEKGDREAYRPSPS